MRRQCRRRDHRGRLERRPDVEHRNLVHRHRLRQRRRSLGEDRRSLGEVHQHRLDVDRPDVERLHQLDEVRLGDLLRLGDPCPG